VCVCMCACVCWCWGGGGVVCVCVCVHIFLCVCMLCVCCVCVCACVCVCVGGGRVHLCKQARARVCAWCQCARAYVRVFGEAREGSYFHHMALKQTLVWIVLKKMHKC
jgi:hypothetical protein